MSKQSPSLADTAALAAAVADPSRLKALLALRQGELCLCQLTEILGLAPSSVSRHMAVLRRAGLVQARKEGRWQWFRLARERQTPREVRRLLAWALASAGSHPSPSKKACKR